MAILARGPLGRAIVLIALTGLAACGKSDSGTKQPSPNVNHLGPTASSSDASVPLSPAQAAYQRRDFATALKLWLPLAKSGNPDAQVSVGLLYQYGQGVPQDYAAALRWFHLAANHGNAAARRSIGFMYETGNGVAQDYAAAFAWLNRAARQGDAGAQMLLGGMYENAEGISQDHMRSYMWLSIAASSNDPMNVASTKFRDGVAAYLTKAELAQAQEMARLCQQSNYRQCEEAENTQAITGTNAVPMKNDGGVYVVPVMINDALTIDFVVDSGASDVSIPADVVLTLIRTNTLEQSDFIGNQNYTLADGSSAPSRTFRIRSLKVGNLVLENVVGSVGDVRSTPLLGQSFLARFTSWSINNDQHALVLNSESPVTSTGSSGSAASAASDNSVVSPAAGADQSELVNSDPVGQCVAKKKQEYNQWMATFSASVAPWDHQENLGIYCSKFSEALSSEQIADPTKNYTPNSAGGVCYNMNSLILNAQAECVAHLK